MEKCQRCQEPSVLSSRNQKFCADCFIKFIRGKHRKMIQAINSNKNEIIEVLVPINFDFNTSSFVNFNSSIALLDVIMNYAKDVYKSYFEVTLLFMLENQKEDTICEIKDTFLKIKRFYGLENIRLKILDLRSFIKINKNLYHISIIENSAVPKEVFETKDYCFPKSFMEYMDDIKNPSTREDTLFNIYWNTIKIYTYFNQIPVVLFSNSMNNIATKILTNIVKGKGLEISQMLSEKQLMNVSNGKLYEFTALYPSKEILNIEILHYIEILKLTQFLPSRLQSEYRKFNDMGTGINNKVLNVKMATINQLVNDYFNDLEKNGYSTIVSTVVSTGSRLALPKGVRLSECPLCHFKHPGNSKDWLDNITVNSSYEEGQEMIRTSKNAHTSDLAKEKLKGSIDICYGCLHSFATVGDKFAYPSTNNIDIKDKEILDEYILEEDD